jgi:hypothetical protein
MKMRRKFIYDKDLEAMIEITHGSNFAAPPPPGVTVIRDIEPYRTAGVDVAAGGKRVVIGSRSQHRQFLARNGYVEVGNEVPVSGSRPQMSREERIHDIKRALGEYGSNTRDR